MVYIFILSNEIIGPIRSAVAEGTPSVAKTKEGGSSAAIDRCDHLNGEGVSWPKIVMSYK